MELSAKLLLFLCAVLQTTCTYCLDCYQCSAERNISDCHQIVTCPDDHLCFTELTGFGDSRQFTMGCKPNQHCFGSDKTVSSLELIARAALRSTDCNKCCSDHTCNKYICSAGSSLTGSLSQHARFILNNGSQGQCVDNQTFNCEQVSTLLNLCADIHHAKTVCRKFCGLCDLVDGMWSSWSSWSNCGVTCGKGIISRARICNNPGTSHGGLPCSGNDTEYSTCVLGSCPVHGGWSLWSSWGSCSVTCGVGLQRRGRDCSNPYPGRYGNDCFGDNRDDRVCFIRACADGGWSAWSAWGSCSTTCYGGIQSRARTCDNPPPSQFGKDCTGNDNEKESCNLELNCPAKQVAFSATTPRTSAVNGVAVFSNIITNIGGGYNSTTGKFTCPVAGLYYFSLDIKDTASSHIYCSITLNGSSKVVAYAYQFTTGTASVYLSLHIGDVVTVSTCYHLQYIDTSYTHFSGALISSS